MDSQTTLPIAGETQVVVNRAGGPVVIDYATGAVTSAGAGAFWCMAKMPYELAQGYVGRNGEQRFDRTSGLLGVPCDALGRRVNARPSLEATEAAGTRVGSHIVVAAPNGYVAFQIR